MPADKPRDNPTAPGEGYEDGVTPAHHKAHGKRLARIEKHLGLEPMAEAEKSSKQKQEETLRKRQRS